MAKAYPVKLKPLCEQTIVVTGASSGIGLTTAMRAACKGANVVLAARNEKALRQAVEDIEANGGSAAYIAVDIADEDAAERVGAVAFERFGGFDSWVNAAAVAIYARVAQVSPAEHRRIFDVGYFGLVAASLYAVAQLKTKGGALVNIGSVLSDRAVPVQGNYAAMKAAVKSFTDTLRMETAIEKGRVSITLIKPNGIDTPYPEHARNLMGKPARIPPLVYDPELVAKAICHCAANPRREILVGGQGAILTRVADLVPGATDIGMELLMSENAQSTDKAPEPGAEDNLFAPRADGRMRSNGRHGRVRKTSLALEAQLHPFAAGLAGLAAAGAAMAVGRLAARKPSR